MVKHGKREKLVLYFFLGVKNMGLNGLELILTQMDEQSVCDYLVSKMACKIMSELE